MSLPTRTDEERARALEAALAARQERARLRAALKAGDVTGSEVVRGAAEHPVWSALKVSWLLESLPGMGEVRAERLMAALRIAPSRRIQGLGERQRAALLAQLDAR